MFRVILDAYAVQGIKKSITFMRVLKAMTKKQVMSHDLPVCH